VCGAVEGDEGVDMSGIVEARVLVVDDEGSDMIAVSM